MTPEERLAFYAGQFPLVEADSTYYAIPKPHTAQLWAERTPPGFVFDVKAFGLLTHHPAPLRSFPKDLLTLLPPGAGDRKNVYYDRAPEEFRIEVWRQFKEALAPLHQARKLGVVVFQFPRWFVIGRESKGYLEQLGALASPYRVAVEFRRGHWLEERNQPETFALLEANGLSFVAVDEPQGFASSVPPVAAVTGPVAVVRFHGRNRETWEKPGIAASERFDYYYKAEELKEWLPRIQELADQAQEVHLSLNTNRGVQGPQNARLLAEVVGAGLPGQGQGQGQIALGL